MLGGWYTLYMMFFLKFYWNLFSYFFVHTTQHTQIVCEFSPIDAILRACIVHLKRFFSIMCAICITRSLALFKAIMRIVLMENVYSKASTQKKQQNPALNEQKLYDDK